MADSEVWTTEDIDDIDSVIQLKPHQKDVEYTTVTKKSDGEDLVSIDELYEKTGQESIDKIIEGFNSLITRNKLSREHGVLLKVEGAESWMELPDRMNAVRGGENFLKTIGQTFVDIIMAIVNFIKGICNWIWARLKSLFGFAKTEEEVKYLCQKSDDFKQETAKVLGAVGIKGFNPNELVKELPSNMMPSEMVKITKSKFENKDELIKQYSVIEKLADKADNALAKFLVDIEKANVEHNRVINHIKKMIKDNQVTSVRDIVPIKQEFVAIADKYLNSEQLVSIIKEMAESFYGINPTKLGVDNHIETIKERLKNEVETVMVKYDKELYEKTTVLVEQFKKSTDPRLDNKFGPNGINHLKNIINRKNVTFIEQLSKIANDKDILLVYLQFTEHAKKLGIAVEQVAKLTQEIKHTIAGLVKLYTKTNNIVCALATHDLSNLTAELDKLTPEERENWDKAKPNTDIFHFRTLNEQFLKEHPNGHLEKQTSDAVGRMLTSQKGKGVMRAFGNYMEGLKR